MFYDLLANGTTLSYPRTPLVIRDPHTVRVHCLLVWDQVAFTLIGVNADPILNDFVIF